MDDRGKFIYISEEELAKFAKFIKQRGRVSIADLVENSSSLITLVSETQDVEESSSSVWTAVQVVQNKYQNLTAEKYILDILCTSYCYRNQFRIHAS